MGKVISNKGEINSFRDLNVWKKSLNLAKMIYIQTQSFPD